MAFSLQERQYLGIHGLLPPAFMTEEQQAYRVISKLRKQPNDLARYIQLDALQVLNLILRKDEGLGEEFSSTQRSDQGIFLAFLGFLWFGWIS